MARLPGFSPSLLSAWLIVCTAAEEYKSHNIAWLSFPAETTNPSSYFDQDISSIDKDFSEESFLDGARKAFRIIVSAYKENNLNTAESLLSPEVFSAFQEQADMYNHKLESFQITQLKAAILNIEVVKKIAKIQ